MSQHEVVEFSGPLATIVEESGLSVESGRGLLEAFQPFFDEARPMLDEASGISVTDCSQVAAMKEARELRLRLRTVRCNAENKRKEIKEDALRTGKAIDRVAGVIKDMISPVEEDLLAKEEFAKRVEQDRKDKLAAERAEKLRPFVADLKHYNLHDMPDAAFEDLLGASKAAAERKAQEEREAAEKAEAERKAREEEVARQREENARLAREKAAAEAEARAAREAAEKAQRELETKQRAEEARKAAERAEADRAARAPDKEKLLAVAEAIDMIEAPEMKTASGEDALHRVGAVMIKAVADIKAIANTL